MLLTPAMAEWPLVTSVPALLSDRPPAIALAGNGDIFGASANRVIRTSQDGSVLWNARAPLEQTVAIAGGHDDGAFAAGWTEAGNFVVKLNANGTVAAIWPIQGEPAAIAVDATGSLYITGSALEGFTATPGAWKTSFFGARRCTTRHGVQTFACSDAFVIKMRPDGAVEWATLLGGTWTDRARSIAIDADGGVWIAGETLSDDFATTPNAVKRKFGGIVTLGPLQYGDGFVARLDKSGSRLLYATYLGGISVDVPFLGTVPVAVDVIQRWPGLFSGALNQDGSVNSESNPASLGSVVSLFGNGFGPEPLPVIEPFITSTTPNVAQGMEVLYAGRAPGTPDGIFQVNVRVPLNAQTGRVPVRLVLRMEQGFLQTPLGYIWIR